MENNVLNNLLLQFVKNPQSAEYNYRLGRYYHEIGQTAAAISYYLRTSERTDDSLLKYKSMLLAAQCFAIQGSRKITVLSMLRHALCVLPKRPEAYFLLSRYHERQSEWHESYLIACMGEKLCDFDSSALDVNVEYPGKYGIIFERAVSSWWCGLCDESRQLFKMLLETYSMDKIHHDSVVFNLQKLCGNTKLLVYENINHGNLKHTFRNSDTIDKNYSEAYQDMFVLSCLDGKKNGTYLEIGAGNAFYGNNTALLETKFGWKGLSIDINEDFVHDFILERQNPCIKEDALKVNYSKVLSDNELPSQIDYLQIDCDPAENTYNILLKIPFGQYKFSVITYEHDYYCDSTKSFRDKSRKYLKSRGYELVVSNVSPDDWRCYEDWWVHPDLVDRDIINKLKADDNTMKNAEQLMLFKKYEFDWGEIVNNKWFFDFLKDEIFVRHIYEKFFTVSNGDVVVDIGASVGPFTYSILNKMPSAVYCVEPHPMLFNTLEKNMLCAKMPAVCINKAITATDGIQRLRTLYNNNVITEIEQGLDVDGISFDTFIKSNNIEKIDFLKIDCEGAEYDIFTEDNFAWINTNVSKIAGEWHLHTSMYKELFRKFRDTYLKNLSNYEIYSIDNVNIKWDLWNEHFIEYYKQIMIYIKIK